jgi:hypothetical protein
MKRMKTLFHDMVLHRKRVTNYRVRIEKKKIFFYKRNKTLYHHYPKQIVLGDCVEIIENHDVTPSRTRRDFIIIYLAMTKTSDGGKFLLLL